MRRSKEIIILFVLLVVSASFVIWYVFDRRAKNRTTISPTALKATEPAPQLGPVAQEPAAPHFEIKPTKEPKAESLVPIAEPQATIQPSSAAPVLIALAPSKVEKAAEIPPVKEAVAYAPAPIPVQVPAQPVATTTPVKPSPQPEPAAAKLSEDTVELGGENEGKTIDFSNGQPVAGTSPEEKAIIEKAVKDMAEARKKVIFKANEKIPEPAPVPAEKK